MARKHSIHPYSGPAGGWGALLETEKVLVDQHVLIKGAISLLSMNQPQGFKCQAVPGPIQAGPFP